ncbi:MAG TPA: hypothetical protein VM598_03005 [Bdellovibrionota bacterium]|nr:hypothetical protein [Bdellovibrionota bacterium]
MLLISSPAHAADDECAQPSYCAPAIRQALRDAWTRARLGFDATEAGFCTVKTGGTGVPCAWVARLLPSTNEHMRISFPWNPVCQEIFHTHPNASIAEPSEGDEDTANHVHRPVYTITNRGLRRYSPGAERSEVLRPNLEWMDPCR